MPFLGRSAKCATVIIKRLQNYRRAKVMHISDKSKKAFFKMKSFLLAILLCMTSSGAFAAASGVYNVRDYGAKGDGSWLDTPAINAAIESAARDGGGQVLLPEVTYLCGSIRLK